MNREGWRSRRRRRRRKEKEKVAWQTVETSSSTVSSLGTNDGEEEGEGGGEGGKREWFRRVNPSASFLVPKFVGFLVSSEGGRRGEGGEVNVSVLTSSWSCGGRRSLSRVPYREGRNLDLV